MNGAAAFGRAKVEVLLIVLASRASLACTGPVAGHSGPSRVGCCIATRISFGGFCVSLMTCLAQTAFPKLSPSHAVARGIAVRSRCMSHDDGADGVARSGLAGSWWLPVVDYS